MKTVLQEIIQWTIENAFNVEAQDGTTYIVIDHEEMRNNFNEWLEKEKEQVINAYDQYLYGGINGCRKFENGTEYYLEIFEKPGTRQIKAYIAVKNHIKETGEKQGKIKCTLCGGDLYYNQAELNGHIWGKCKCGLAWME